MCLCFDRSESSGKRKDKQSGSCALSPPCSLSWLMSSLLITSLFSVRSFLWGRGWRGVETAGGKDRWFIKCCTFKGKGRVCYID